MKKLFILSLGGSLVVPDDIDTVFLSKLKRLIEIEAKKGSRFILIIGGGRTCRKYQHALVELGNKSHTDLDWMGIATTWVNAEFVRLMFGKHAHNTIVKDPNHKVNFKEKILVAGGWEPGRSTDDDAVRLAYHYGAKTLINLSNIDYLYTKDPKKFKDAKKIEQGSWSEFRAIVGSKRIPGGNYPFDPVAGKLAEQQKLELIIANGRNLKNLQHILQGKKFVGTTIS